MNDHVTAAVERELGSPPDAVERVETGLLHETYRVRCRSEAYVVQFLDHEEGHTDDPARGLGCYRLLADAPVPVPRVVSDGVATLGDRAYTVVTALPGSTAERDPTRARARTAGRTLARVHAAATFERAGWLHFEDGAPTVEPYESGSLRAHVLVDVDDHVATLRRAGLTAAADAAVRFLDAHRERFPGEVRPVLCHGDFSPDNLLFDGDRLTGVVDFDRARASDPCRDLSRAGNAVWLHDPTADWDPRGTLLEGYRAVRDPGPHFERTEPLYRVETLVRTLAGMVERDALSAYEREFYDEHLPRVVADAASALPE